MKETDLWQKELQSIDTARKDNMAEEDLLKIHRGITNLALRYDALEKRVQALEQFKQRMEAGTLKTLRLKDIWYRLEPVIYIKKPRM